MEVFDKQDNAEFLCERCLSKLDSNLHNCFKNSIFAIDRLLANYKMVFPFYTDHTLEHSEQVIRYVNYFLGVQNANKLNADELYVLLMGALLHDIGMGISKKDFEEFSPNIEGMKEYLEANSDSLIEETTREFHQEFSVEFIKKYKDLFEIPTEKHLFCIGQIARGHRRHNLCNKEEFDPEYKLDNGNVVRLPYLAGLVKIADEMDIANERNLLINYDEYTQDGTLEKIMCFKAHEAVYRIEFDEDIQVFFNTDEEIVLDEINKINKKVLETFRQYKEAVSLYTEFISPCKNIYFIRKIGE